jgi:hypothetical protein
MDFRHSYPRPRGLHITKRQVLFRINNKSAYRSPMKPRDCDCLAATESVMRFEECAISSNIGATGNQGATPCMHVASMAKQVAFSISTSPVWKNRHG